MRDPKILKKIVAIANLNKEDVVLEVGPGEGLMTQMLLDRVGKVIAVEKDSDMVSLLREKFKNEIISGRLEVVEADILKFKIENLKLKIIGNIPYYITGAILRHTFETEKLPTSITFVVQKEVAERVVAKDGKESVLSISVKAYGTPHFGGVIKAGSFFPAPKIDSAILHISDISRKNFEQCSEENFFKILKFGFAHKRKILLKNLSESFKIKSDDLRKIFAELKIDEKARAEEISVESWKKLASKIFLNGIMIE